jgi:predicted MFS family arabinose efflux permease
MGLVMIPLPFVEGFVMLAVVLFLAGFAISPTLIASAAWIEEIVPADRLTEALTVFTTGLGAGIAPGAAIVGVVVDASGASAAYWVCAVAGLSGALVAFVTARMASEGRPSPSESPASGPPRSS